MKVNLEGNLKRYIVNLGFIVKGCHISKDLMISLIKDQETYQMIVSNHNEQLYKFELSSDEVYDLTSLGYIEIDKSGLSEQPELAQFNPGDIVEVISNELILDNEYFKNSKDIITGIIESYRFDYEYNQWAYNVGVLTHTVTEFNRDGKEYVQHFEVLEDNINISEKAIMPVQTSNNGKMIEIIIERNNKGI